MNKKYSKLKAACYSANISMSIVSSLSPVLFLIFRTLYGISYSKLGLLVLISFITQLGVDLIFSFFSHKFNIPTTLRINPLLTIIGLIIYSLSPWIFKDNVYIGLVIGTFIFSAASGLNEVLISPTIASIPSKDPDREMSKLHSVFAWGVVAIIIFSTVFLLLFGQKSWQILSMIFIIVPLISFILFSTSKIPEMETPKKVSGALALLKNKGVWACVAAIFLGGASECTMSQWSSSYLEQALGIPKIWGDIFGVAMFSVMLSLGRTLYAKIGKNINKIIILGFIGCVICYLAAAISNIAIIGLIACAFTGFCASMLWPGNLIIASDRFPAGGVFIYALMAAGGDLGASVGPQLVGIVTDLAIKNPKAIALASTLELAPEQLGMKLGLLVGMLFPLAAFLLFGHLKAKNK
ncbi:MAG: MFS transporter [Clostridia bacterium]|nr:MFS transporter [Clostridia bacterium]